MTGSKIVPSTQLVTRLESDMGEIISRNFKRFAIDYLWLAETILIFFNPKKTPHVLTFGVFG